MRNFNDKVLLSTLALLLGACNGVGSGDVERSVAAQGDPGAGSVSHMASDVVVSQKAPGQTTPVGDDWEAWLAAEVERIRRDDPSLVEAIAQLEPRITRARFLRFTDPVLENPDAAPLLLDRYVNGNESAEVRAALVEAIPRTGGAFGPAFVDLLAREKDAPTRVNMVAAMRMADGASARAGLAQGLVDSDERVREKAALTVARHREGAKLVDSLVVVAATDSSSGVKRAAAQSLGALKVEQAKDALVGLLSEDDADLRFVSLRALERIDAAYVRALPKVRAMRDDPDPRVAKLATRLTE